VPLLFSAASGRKKQAIAFGDGALTVRDYQVMERGGETVGARKRVPAVQMAGPVL